MLRDKKLQINQAFITIPDVTAKKQSRGVQLLADVNSCNSGIQLRSIKQAPRNAIPEHNEWDGRDRRIQHFAIVKERRKCYLVDTPDFQALAEKARKTVMNYATDLKELPFPEAANTWLEKRSLYIRESTMACYKDYISRLITYFTMPLKEIHIGHFQEYQSLMRKKYHPASVNHDLNTLTQILKSAELWNTSIGNHYRPLPLPELDPVKVMSDAQEDAFFLFASKQPETWLAYYVASLTNNSTASGKELRMLQRSAVDLEADPPYFRVPKNMKNPNRQRLIPLNERGADMMQRILRKAAERGSTRPEHFVFPFRLKRNLFDPNRPASESWIKAQWKKLVDAAIEAKVLNFRIKPHNLRHQVITKMLDNGVPIETVRQIAGHGVDSLITRHYHHARVETLARALDVIDPNKKKPGYTPKVKGVSNAG